MPTIKTHQCPSASDLLATPLRFLRSYGFATLIANVRPLALTSAQQHRLEKLAREAGRLPRAMLKFVLRDGFDVCEDDVREARAADAELAAGRALTHAEAMARARAAIAPNARRPRKAA